MIIYTRRGLPSWSAAAAFGPIIVCDPAYKGDQGLIAHEVEHTRQWWGWLVLCLSLTAIYAAQIETLSTMQGIVVGIMAGLSLGLHHILYALFPWYRLWAEVNAYRVQLEYSPGRERLFAGFIYLYYRTNRTEDEIFAKLRGT